MMSKVETALVDMRIEIHQNFSCVCRVSRIEPNLHQIAEDSLLGAVTCLRVRAP